MWIMVDIFPLGSKCGLWLIFSHLDPHLDYGWYFSTWIHMWIMVDTFPLRSKCGLWLIFFHLDPHVDYG